MNNIRTVGLLVTYMHAFLCSPVTSYFDVVILLCHFSKTFTLLQINKACRELTGYSHEVVEVLSHRLHCDFLSVCALAKDHLNLTHAQASVVLSP